MQRLKNIETNSFARVCDSCYSNHIRQNISKFYSDESENQIAEIYKIQQRYIAEKTLCENQSKLISLLQTEIRDFGEKERKNLSDLEGFSNVLSKDIEKLEADYEELKERYEAFVMQNWDDDWKIQELAEENQEFGGEIPIRERINLLEEEVKELLKGCDGNDSEAKKEHLHEEEMKLFRLKQDLAASKKEKEENLARIQKMKEILKLKNSNLAMLVGKLALVNEINLENEEEFEVDEMQSTEISKLERRLSKVHRKLDLQATKCHCEIM